MLSAVVQGCRVAGAEWPELQAAAVCCRRLRLLELPGHMHARDMPVQASSASRLDSVKLETQLRNSDAPCRPIWRPDA